MHTKAFRYTTFALEILEKILGSKFTVTGVEKLPNQPILFVGNHFTRSETFFVPYIINKHTGRQIRCLADSGLFHGTLGRFLTSLGTVSTKDPNRDKTIIKDLITGDYDWMIYPEGSMIKSKEIKKQEGFVSYTPYRIGPVRTGSSVLALQSQIIRDNLINAFDNNKIDILKDLKSSLDVEYNQNLQALNTYIVPVNITYYPIRPGRNVVEKLALRLVKNIPEKIREELEIEGNIMTNADINLSFGEPINLSNYIKSTKLVIDKIPVIKHETKTNLLLKYFKHRLTNDFMAQVYNDVLINLDHLFVASLYFSKQNEISIERLKRTIYLSANIINKSHKFRIQESIFEENLFKIFIDEPHKGFDSAFSLAKEQNLIREIGNGKIFINKQKIIKKFDFHQIRTENTFQVILNEFLLVEKACDVVRRVSAFACDQMRKKVFQEIYKHDLQHFEQDYQIYFDEKFSKEKSIGAPFYLDSKANSSIRKIGILLVHGYKSAPMEVLSLAQFLNQKGFKVYCPRLKGHGTAPQNMKFISWHDWYDSVQKGYAALSNSCSKIVLVGFSTGGLLSLLSAAEKSKNSQNKIAGIVSINSAIKLMDIKARMVPGIEIWNDMLDKLHIEKGKFEYVDDKPENPHINYSRNYLHGVAELEKLMSVCEENLENITSKTLVMQAKKDPVVHPISGKIIFDKIKSEDKFLLEMNFDNHVIINSEKKEEVFVEIEKFLQEIQKQQS